jgi:hypothetical protein
MPSEVFVGVPSLRAAFTPRRNRHGVLTAAARDAAEYLARRAATRGGTADAGEPEQEEPPF